MVAFLEIPSDSIDDGYLDVEETNEMRMTMISSCGLWLWLLSQQRGGRLVTNMIIEIVDSDFRKYSEHNSENPK